MGEPDITALSDRDLLAAYRRTDGVLADAICTEIDRGGVEASKHDT